MGRLHTPARVRAIIDVIVHAIEPNSWVQNSGQGTIQVFGSQLVIRNNILVHQLLGGPVEEGG